MDWRAAPHAEGAGLAQSAMLPLIVGGPEPAPASARPAPEADEAEIAAERA
jgi:hypothetical protein